ncbi:hypothetical protein GF323_06375 [Candidatus Woesearchaeota archaeon]|nr:hypothetical protein [Candidatus Woesearchaeota archaeon]
MSDNRIFHFILDWAEKYFKSRDAYNKKITGISRDEDGFTIKYREKQEKIIAIDDLNRLDNSKLGPNLSIVTLNNRKNLDYLYRNWGALLRIEALRIYFINPFSITDKKWAINPNIHSKITEEASLKPGLLSIFETVEPLTPEILMNKL